MSIPVSDAYITERMRQWGCLKPWLSTVFLDRFPAVLLLLAVQHVAEGHQNKKPYLAAVPEVPRDPNSLLDISLGNVFPGFVSMTFL